MITMLAGLVLFIGGHSLRLFAPGWRQSQIDRLGERGWKILFSLESFLGFGLIVWGFAQMRAETVVIYQTPDWMKHVTIAFAFIGFILFAAARVPNNIFKAKLGHPMVAGVKSWAFGHLLANGRLHDLILFGSLLLWSIASFALSRRRDRKAGIAWPAASLRGTIITILGGLLVGFIFVKFLHGPLIGVYPMG